MPIVDERIEGALSKRVRVAVAEEARSNKKVGLSPGWYIFERYKKTNSPHATSDEWQQTLTMADRSHRHIHVCSYKFGGSSLIPMTSRRDKLALDAIFSQQSAFNFKLCCEFSTRSLKQVVKGFIYYEKRWSSSGMGRRDA